MQIETMMKYQLISVRMVIIKRQEITSVSEDVEKKKHLYSVSGNINWFSHYGKEDGGSSKNLK